MIWPVRALVGPVLWAVSFSAIYAAHGLGCAWDWPSLPAPVGDLHRFVLVSMWIMAIAATAAVCHHGSRAKGEAGSIIRLADRIGLVAVLLTLFPVAGVSTCV